MAPASTHLSIRLTEPVVFLTGGTEHERARARRRRGARALGTPTVSRPGSRPGSRAGSPAQGLLNHLDEAFIPPGPQRARNRDSRQQSPAPGGGSRSASRQRAAEGTTTGNGTVEEAEAADEPPPAMLRGLLTLTLAKPSRIRDISMRLRGISRTDWPEGIGPRRLDVMEETILTSNNWTFFAASDNERRAVSIGPGVREHSDLDARGRQGARRSASLMPTRDTSIGMSYPSWDSAIHEDEREDSANNIRQSLSTLSRVASFSNLESVPLSPSDVPPVQPWEQAPAYEATSSAPSTPVPATTNSQTPLSRINSVDSFDLSRHSPSHNNRFARSPTPSRSPLNPSNSSARLESGRPETGNSQLSQDDNTPPSPVARPALLHVNSSGSGTGPSLLASNSDAESERGRPARRDPTSHQSFGISGHDSPMASTSSLNGSGSDMHAPASPLDSYPYITTLINPSHSATTSRSSLAPSILSSPSLTRVISPDIPLANGRRSSLGPPPARSSSTRPSSRFSLSGLADTLRGKSSSRARESSLARDMAEKNHGRAESPDARAGGGRDQSRGRRTALKSLRDALTSPLEIGEGDDSGDDFGDEDDFNGKGKGRSKGWKEFRAGTYTYPISIPVPASLPPTINSDFGNVTYTLKATVHRAGALTSNLTAISEVVLVSCPGQDDTEDSESIVVERFWETQMRYHIALSGKSFPIGSVIPISIRLHPLAKIKLYRITVTLEQKTNYFASGRKLTRHETPKKFPLLRIENRDPKEALLPIFSDNVNAIKDHPLSPFFINPTSSDDTTPSLLDTFGPWQLEGSLKMPECATRINFSTHHEKANITVSHMLKIMLRVERGDDDFLDSKGKRKLWDVIIETPIHVLSCRCTQNTLPAYSYAIPGTSVASSSGTSTTLSSTGNNTPAHAFAAPASCGFNHSSTALATPIHVRTSAARSLTPAPALLATLEQSLLYARLVGGEETTEGEVPPAYAAAISTTFNGTSLSLERTRSSSTSGSSIVGSIMTARVGRTGRSSSVASGGSGGGRGRSISTNLSARSDSTNAGGGRNASTARSGGRSASVQDGDRSMSLGSSHGRSGSRSGAIEVRAGRSGSIVTVRAD